ncbi:adenosylcobinamide-GDP ribazoletransferase [Oceanotoga sp. DSM 15011]|jgi:adenosylcobinamide-GDP ribazoletransferase|uniref:Adenosylcobinamide-GDP ribazoletransferase n=1 Tax=Oceanotoga teriensis TaxID=515440 RepID=A0AA45C7K9_9BACT|nr:MULTISPECIES: adenosylcobinamide-GDP ribazoletransferase [Oceanotoga]MDN5342147.1 adenosylcobinamide-GDP ribazoletransferase [Oceanotoga sp.]MDO7976225.1 adenosylcobinamide-GDP ribazoletransferase [Oceanotoga teriensis]PWJ95422.1 cobalamin-5'-phosphate synthase [Oceanotoga teriensis]UYP01061.1 adenosylcobinamide-GDP ribazoletransferase [Oceanotoga sp. DSM 15011]
MLNDIFVAFGTISRIPVPTVKNVNIKRSVIYFPLVGIFASFVLWLFQMIFINIFNINITFILNMILYFYLFQYFHFDGILDLFDGFGAQIRDIEERRKILKDSRIGAFSLLYGIFYIILYIFLIFQNKDFWYMMPIFSRFSVPVLLSISKPAFDEGLGKMYFPFKKLYLIPSFLIVSITAFISLKIFLIGIISSIISSFLLNIISNKKINGINGDVIGANICLTEIIFLLIINIK